MSDSLTLSLKVTLGALRAAGQSTRLRLLILLQGGELTVKDLTQILGQSQPRISRHLKLLLDAGLIERFPEGSWVYYRLARGALRALLDQLLSMVDPSGVTLQRDQERLDEVKALHAQKATRYFAKNAQSWDKIRQHHISDKAVEALLLNWIGDRPFQTLLDVGTGTGRMLQLFQALYSEAIGIDTSQDMLAVARANLVASDITHAEVRLGDIFNLTLEQKTVDVAVIHQVLHFLDDPGHAVAKIAKLLRPGRRMLIVDFAPHTLEFLREDEAHRRLGFSHSQMAEWLAEAGLQLVRVTDLSPENIEHEALTITVWLAQDPRMLMAENDVSTPVRIRCLS